MLVWSCSRSTDNDSATASLTIAPGCDWFFTDDMSVGGALTLDMSRSQTSDTGQVVDLKSFAIGANPRLGYNRPINDWLSFYTQAGFWFETGSSSAHSVSADNSPKYTRIAFDVAARLIAEVSPHFFLGFGPTVFFDLSRTAHYDSGYRVENDNTTLALSSIFGGWF